ncbi:hypothetical protein BVRB_2g042950 [Beta vulgaris subsp. vulgaris]|nr:hypothetical protein BVRB_2g042950 [Beta vulgaris subsp. vulgaris]
MKEKAMLLTAGRRWCTWVLSDRGEGADGGGRWPELWDWIELRIPTKKSWINFAQLEVVFHVLQQLICVVGV